MPKLVKPLLVIGLAAVLVAALVAFTPPLQKCSWDFRTNLWGPTNELLHGRAPYTESASYGPYSSVWMPVGIGGFFWLGWLPCETGAKLWLIAELAGLLVLFWLLAGRRLPAPGLFLAGLLVIFLYPPLYTHLILGQFGLFFCLLTVMVIFSPRSDRWAPLLLVLGLIKPQLGILVYPGLLVWLLHERGWAGTGRFLLRGLGWAALLTLPLWILHLAWPAELAWITQKNLGTGWAHPSLYALLTTHLGQVGLLLWLVIFLAGLGLALWLWAKRDPREALVWSLALTPLATPYVWSWDFVLLLPCLLWLLLNSRGALARGVLLAGTFSVAVAQVAVRWGHNVDDQSFWWIPPALLAVCLFSLLAERRAALAATPAETSAS